MSHLTKTADIEGPYRYRLSRVWDSADGPRVLWIMLNPSTADAEQDDPTIRKCIGFSRRWGYSGLVVVNLYAFRATDPRELPKALMPIGPRNDQTIREEITNAALIMAAWGRCKFAEMRAQAVKRLLAGQIVNCLGTNGDGSPSHPLMVPYSRERCFFPINGAAGENISKFERDSGIVRDPVNGWAIRND